MTARRRRRIAAVAAGLIACCLLLSLWVAARVRDATSSRTVSSVLLEPRQARAASGPARPDARNAMRSVAAPLAVCEARIEREPHRVPTVAIVGASYTAGTGPGNPELSWAVDLARLQHWNAVIYGVPGAGYLRSGAGGRGPMARLLSGEGLRGLGPSLVIVQAGHNDIGMPAALERQRVGAVVDQIRVAAPAARIALLTTFAASMGGSPALRRTDRAITAAGATADPGVIVMDPLAGRWKFPRAGDGLHPTAAGDAWIARTVAAVLLARGVRPAPVTSTAPVICDVSVGAGKPA
ncbi:MAG: SGNH/GDSL hydrolase family protein, partial [Trebonia sp.]